ncbi:MAG: FecR domain-containing protein [Cyclobacteriaceae bacterium]
MSRNNSLTNSEKARLKNRIFDTIESVERKKSRKKVLLGIAASFLILAGTWSVLYLDTTEDISRYALDFEEDFTGSKDVQLILSQGNSILLTDDSSSITYSKSGQFLDLGDSKILTQDLAESKVTYNTVLVPYGRRLQIMLSDGTVAWLNSGTRLVYPATFQDGDREVYLEGEAIFDVKHDVQHPFRVISDNQEIEVLGTIFNVSSYKDETENFVVLKSGRVQVTHKNNSRESGRSFEITPGTKANLNLITGESKIGNVNVDQYFSWREGVLILKSNSLEHIMNKLSKYYNEDIWIWENELGKETFSGYLDLKDDIEKVIKTIQQSTSFNFRRTEDNKILITTK